MRGFVRYVPRRRRKRSGERGFSLVETLAALLVFAIITLGLVPLLAGSIRGSDLTRRATSGKQIVTEAMERVRGLPFYIDYNTQASKVDVLDLYFPARTPTYAAGTCTGYLNTGTTTCTATGYAATGPSYVTTCPDASNVACPQDLPDNYTLTFETSFASTVTGGTETYTKTAPGTSYAYSTSGSDRPPVLLVEMVITARWTTGGRGPRTYQIRTLLSDRRFSGLKLLGEATIDYAVQFVAGYSNQGTTGDAELTVTGGNGSARIEVRRTATSSATTTAAEITYIDLSKVSDTDPTNDNIDGPLTGATSTVVAPPDATDSDSELRQTADHPNASHGIVGGMDNSDADTDVSVETGNLPTAEATFDFGTSSLDDVWAAHKQDDNDLSLDDSEDWIARVVTQASDSMTGSATATTNALGTQPGVATEATASFEQLQIFLSSDSDDIEDDIDDRFDGALVAITGPRDGSGDPSGSFETTATCNADNDGTQNTDAAEAAYSGTLWYWKDEENNNDVDEDDANQYEWVDLATGNSSELGAGTSLSATLESLQSGSAIMVLDRNPDTKDVYLFQNGSNPYYLSDWAAGTAPVTSVTNGGRTTSARLETALGIETAPLEGSGEPDTNLGINVGAVSCRAEDNR